MAYYCFLLSYRPGILQNSALIKKAIHSFSAQLLWESWMYCCFLLSNRECIAEIRLCCPARALWCSARGRAVCGVQASEGGARATGWPPIHRKLFLRNTDDDWLGVPVTEEALSSHQLRQTSQNLFHGLEGPPVLKTTALWGGIWKGLSH